MTHRLLNAVALAGQLQRQNRCTCTYSCSVGLECRHIGPLMNRMQARLQEIKKVVDCTGHEKITAEFNNWKKGIYFETYFYTLPSPSQLPKE